jgi:hypothetical protein
MTVLGRTGVRRGELLDMDVGDFDWVGAEYPVEAEGQAQRAPYEGLFQQRGLSSTLGHFGKQVKEEEVRAWWLCLRQPDQEIIKT